MICSLALSAFVMTAKKTGKTSLIAFEGFFCSLSFFRHTNVRRKIELTLGAFLFFFGKYKTVKTEVRFTINHNVFFKSQRRRNLKELKALQKEKSSDVQKFYDFFQIAKWATT